MERYLLSPHLSFRTLKDVAIVVDHSRAEILRLNVAAGEVLDRIEGGREPLDDDDREFAEVLVERGLAYRQGESPVVPATEAPTEAPTLAAEHTDLLDRLNEHAAGLLVPLHAQLELTYRCPLSCRYCYLGAERGGTEPELSTDEVTSLLDDLAQLGGLFLLLTGGEPLVRDDFEAIVEHARSRRFAVSVLTSGWGMDRALMARLVAGGLDSVQISLHGAEPKTHDGMTGVVGSFDQALTALRFLRDHGARTLAAITVTRGNLDELPALRALVEREAVGFNVSFYVLPERSGSRAPQRELLDEAGLRRAHEVFPPGSTCRMAARGLADPPCGAGASAVAIDPFGGVYPCHSLRTPVGSLRQASLAEIWSSSEALSEVRELTVGQLVDCPGCAERDRCNRCTGFAVAEGGTLRDHAPFDCLQAQVLCSK